MKKTTNSLTLFALLLCLFSACTNNTDKLLVDLLDVDALVNPAVSNITTGTEVRAWLYADSAMIGFGGNYAFYTPNDFDSLFAVAENAQLRDGKLLYNDFEHLVVQPTEGTLNLLESDDYGQNYYTKIEKSNIEERNENGVFISGTHQFGAVAMAGIDIGWAFSTYTAISGHELFDSATKVYNIIKNGSSGVTEMTHIADLPMEYRPVDATFFNALSGYLLTRSNSKNYVFATGDGGYSWEGPFEVSNTATDMLHIEVYDPQNLYLYSETQTKIYASHDAGMTWQVTEPYLANLSYYGVLDIYSVNDQIAFATLGNTSDNIATIGDVYKTTNGGNTWVKANTKAMYAQYIDCIDENICIATSNNVVQITRDGGVTWKVLVYPI